LGTPHPAAVAIRITVFDVHKSVTVAELQHVVRSHVLIIKVDIAVEVLNMFEVVTFIYI
jgi:hypothetical protein